MKLQWNQPKKLAIHGIQNKNKNKRRIERRKERERN